MPFCCRTAACRTATSFAFLVLACCGPAAADSQRVSGAAKATAHLNFKIVVPPVMFVAVGPVGTDLKAAPCHTKAATVCVAGNHGHARLYASAARPAAPIGAMPDQALAGVMYTAATP